MSLVIRFSPRCYADIKRIRYRVAERTCMAVFAFARDGSGVVEPCDPADPLLVRVRARGGFAVARLRPSENALEVHGIYASMPERFVAPLL